MIDRTANTPTKQSTQTSKGVSTVGKRGTGAIQPTLTVRSVIPNPTKCLLDQEEIEEFDETLIA
jgi:hypothetical protein